MLAEKLADGEGLTASEAGTLEDMRGVAAAFKDALADTRSGKEEGRLFLGDGRMLDGFPPPSTPLPNPISTTRA